jgi:transposase
MEKNNTTQPKDWREERRLQAWRLKQKGWKQKDIAEALGVTTGAVSQWMKRAREEGAEALRHRRGGGRKPRLSEEQLSELPNLLGKGAEHFGFRGEVWTQARVGKIIEHEYGVRYHPRHVGRILKTIAWSRQKPIEKASQRDEVVIEHWRVDQWPGLEKKPRRKNAP